MKIDGNPWIGHCQKVSRPAESLDVALAKAIPARTRSFVHIKSNPAQSAVSPAGYLDLCHEVS
jgi:hypothetical protein